MNHGQSDGTNGSLVEDQQGKMKVGGAMTSCQERGQSQTRASDKAM